MRHEFWIRAGAQLMKVQALALSLDRHAERIKAIEEPIHAVGQRQYKPQQRGHPYQLSQPLAGSDSIHGSGQRISRNIQHGPLKLAEHAQREETPNAPNGMHGNRAARIVDFHAQLKPFDRKRDHRARDRADHNGFGGTHEGARRAAGDESTDPAVGGERSIGLAEANFRDECRGERRSRRGEHGIDADQRGPGRFASREEDRAGGIESNPTDEGQHATKQYENRIVTGDCGRHAVRGIFPAPRTQDPRDRQGREAAQDLNRAGSPNIKKSAANSIIDAELRKPPAAPHPMREKRC